MRSILFTRPPPAPSLPLEVLSSLLSTPSRPTATVTSPTLSWALLSPPTPFSTSYGHRRCRYDYALYRRIRKRNADKPRLSPRVRWADGTDPGIDPSARGKGEKGAKDIAVLALDLIAFLDVIGTDRAFILGLHTTLRVATLS